MSVNGARGGRSSACILSSKHLASQSQVISEAALPERQTASQQVSQFRRGPPALGSQCTTPSQEDQTFKLICDNCRVYVWSVLSGKEIPRLFGNISITCTLLISIYGTRPIPRYCNTHAAVRRRRSAMEDAQKLAKRHARRARCASGGERPHARTRMAAAAAAAAHIGSSSCTSPSSACACAIALRGLSH